MKILISRCLVGALCRYDGQRIIHHELLTLLEGKKLYFICPEVEGGLTTPRPPAERVGERVLTSEGEDVTKAFQRGAEIALRRAKTKNIDIAILKEGSPSCAVHEIYDGSFAKKTIRGQGVTTQKLIEEGFQVFSEEEIDKIIDRLKEEP